MGPDAVEEISLDTMEITGTYSTLGASTIHVLTMLLKSVVEIITMNLATSQNTSGV